MATPSDLESVKSKVSKFGYHRDKKTPRLIVEIPKEVYTENPEKLIDKEVLIVFEDTDKSKEKKE
jgi:hypothetical protein|tara:strand:- start:1212 stop:1406 length:195 start_codon:yes stop_codon:yes gene_type:complete